MARVKRFLGNLRRTLRSHRRFEQLLLAELEMHVERLAAYNLRAGMSPEQARLEARRRLGLLRVSTGR